MRSFQFVPVPAAFADRVRAQRADDFGNADIAPRTATSRPGFPCRVCLRDAEVGERVLLCSYTAFGGPAPYRAIGPIFLHEHRCEPFVDRGEVPEVLRERLVSLRALDARDEQLVHADLADGGQALLERAEAFFADPRVDHVDVHFARPGCLACRLERRRA